MTRIYKKWMKTIQGLSLQKLSSALMVILLLTTVTTYADSTEKTLQNVIVGTVTDNAGTPLPGVTVVIKGTSTGVSTDFDGKYSINANSGDVLEFSFMGMKSESITVGNATTIDITMEEDSNILDEVIVVGYGTTKKANLTGAVAQVGSEVFEDRAVPTVGAALQGVIPNLNVGVSSGSPNATAAFNIRGYESLNGGEPLILVDGVPFGNLNLLNPEDIANVTVLKDAASAAIYGARGSFGVIIITTKSGKKNKGTQIKFSTNYALSDPIVKFDEFALGSLESIEASGLSRRNAGKPPLYGTRLVEGVRAYREDPINNPIFFKFWHNGLKRYRYETYADTNPYKEAYKSFSPRQTYNLSLNGGTEKSKYYVSLGYVRDEGLWRDNADVKKRYNTRFKYTFEVNKWLETGFNVAYNESTYNEPHNYPDNGSLWHAIERSRPWNPTVSTDAFPEGAGLPMNHAYSFVTHGGRDITNYQQTNLTGNIVLKPIEHLKINIDYTHRNSTNQRHLHQRQFSMLIDPGYDWYGQSDPSWTSRSMNRYSQDILDIFGTYERDFGKHNFSLMAGYNQTSSETVSMASRGNLLISQDKPSLNLVMGDVTASDSNTFSAIRGYFGRLKYNYDGKYLVEVNARYDGSDKFPKGSRYGFFPSVSAGWVISKEGFFRDNINFISNLKARASFGSIGNQSVPSNLFRPNMSANPNLGWLIDGVRPVAVSPAPLVSDELTWETVTTRNFGVDLGFFNNKLNISGDIYKRIVSDMIVGGEPVPATLGAAPPQRNAADLETKGFEVVVNWRQSFDSGISYSIGGTLADNRSFITKYDLNPNGLINKQYVGREIGEVWGFETVGIFQSKDDYLAAPTQNQMGNGQRWTAGDVQYADLNDDGNINYGARTLEDPGDRKIIGNANSRFNYGINGTFAYKGFDIRLFFRGVGKKDVWFNAAAGNYWGHTGVGNNAYSTGNKYMLENSWTPENPDARFPLYEWNNRHNTNHIQTRFKENGAFLRLKSLDIGYTLPKEVVGKAGLDNVRVYFTGQNLWTKEHLRGMFDPELLGNASSTTAKVYPSFRSFAFGLNISL